MHSPLTSQSSIATLTELWLAQLRAEARLERTTINEYERVLLKLDHVSAGWSELCCLAGHHAANRLPATDASISSPEEVCTVTPVTSLPT